MRQLALLSIVLLALSPGVAAPQQSCTLPIVVVAEPQQNVVPRFVVDGARCGDLNAALTKTLLQCGRDLTVVYLIHERVAAGTLLDLQGVANKVGFSDVRFFLFVDSRRMMVPFGFGGPAVPFTTERTAIRELLKGGN
jgi:hypothetical protein